MYKFAVVSLVLVMATVANAAIEVRLDVTDMGPTAGGAPVTTFNGGDFAPMLGVPVNPGTPVLVHVYMTSDADLDVRAALVEWRTSTYPWDLMGTDVDNDNYPPTGAHPDDVPNFWFDYTGLYNQFGYDVGSFPPNGEIGGFFSPSGDYTDFSNLNQGDPLVPWVPQTAWSPSGAGDQISMAAGVEMHLGAMPIVVPQDPGPYTLDAVTPTDVNDLNYGTTIQYGFGGTGDPIEFMSSATGDSRTVGPISYGPVTRNGAPAGAVMYADGVFTIVPEPASLALLAIGGLAVLRRRRSA